jgi:hypothetical protein
MTSGDRLVLSGFQTIEVTVVYVLSGLASHASEKRLKKHKPHSLRSSVRLVAAFCELGHLTCCLWPHGCLGGYSAALK